MNHVFVLGCPRSGTTMLQQALNRHSQIVIPPETKFFYYLYGRSRGCAARHVERLNGDLGLGLVPPGEPVRTASEGRALFAEMARQYLQRLGRDGVAWFGMLIWNHYQRAVRRLREDTAFELHHVRYEDLVAEPQRELAGIRWFRPVHRAVRFVSR